MNGSPPTGDLALSQVWTDPVTRTVVGVVTRDGIVQAAGFQITGGGSISGGTGLTDTTTVKTSAYTAVAGDNVLVSTASAAQTTTTPASPVNKQLFGVKHVIQGSTAGVPNWVTIQANTGVTFNDSGSTAETLKLSGQSGVWQFDSSLSAWVKLYGDTPLGQLDLRYDAIGTAGGAQVQEQSARRTVAQGAYIPVATRNNNYYLGVNGSSSSQTFRSKHRACADITSVALEYGNSYGTTGGAQGDGPGALSVGCCVEWPAGTIWRGFFYGAHLGTVNPGSVLRTDPIGVFIPKGSFFYVRTYVSGNWPAGMSLNVARGLGQDTTGDPSVTNDSGEGIASPSTTDVTVAGNIASSFVISYTPFSILGTTRTPGPVFILVGDSISAYSDEVPDMGWAVRALASQYPLIKLAQPGETAAQWVADGTAASLVEARRRLFHYGTHFLFTDGRNDLSGSHALAAIQADLISAWNMAAAQAGASWQSTITPKTTSTDQFSTLANQAPDASETTRVALNTWIRDGAPMLSGAAVASGSSAAGTVRAGQAGHPLAGYLEVADVIESARNSGKFTVAQVRAVADGASTATTKTITSATAAFTSADLGKSVFVAGAGSAGAVLATTITNVGSATSVTVAATAATTVSAAALQIGAATYDGTHPDGFWHRAIATAVAPQLTAAATAYLAGGV